MTADRGAYQPLPHDPANGLTVKTPGNPCNQGCAGDWPCYERSVQRMDSRAIADYLRSDLFKPVPSGPAHDQEGNTWESPLGWRVWVSYARQGLMAEVYAPDGTSTAGTAENATAEWLRAVLYAPAGPPARGDGVES